MARMTAKGGLTILRETCGRADLEWEIQNFLEQPYRKGEYIRSPNFLLGDAVWFLHIFPNGDTRSTSDGWISLFLFRSRSLAKHSVSNFFGIKADGAIIQNGKFEYTFTKKDFSLGYSKFILRSTLSGILRGASSTGSVTVVCNARMLDDLPQDVSWRLRPKGECKEDTDWRSRSEGKSKTDTSLTSSSEGQCKADTSFTPQFEGDCNEDTSLTSGSEGMQAFAKKFEELFLGRNWSDIKIKIGDREIDAHKLVLRARSPVFAAMFEHEMAESKSGVVQIPDMDPDTFKDFLLFVYSGQFSHVTPSNAMGLYKAADKYNFEELKKECRHRMMSDMSVNSVLDVISLAVTYDEDDIIKKAAEFFIENYEETISTE